MKHIFIYIGSNSGAKSNTKYLIDNLIKRFLVKAKGEVHIDFFTGTDTDFNECTGCLTCFKKGLCPLDVSDDMGKLKEAVLKADLIIMASPVYFHGVSSNMKKLMDRMSYWIHCMFLSGKYGIAVATSGGNGLEHVTQYINKFYDYLGVHSIYNLTYISYTMEKLRNTEITDRMSIQIDTCVDRMLHYLYNCNLVDTGEFKEKIFRYYKSKALELKDYKDDYFEIGYWNSDDISCYQTFHELFFDRLISAKREETL